MPPVRWKLLTVTTFCLVHISIHTDAQIMQDAISMTSDGWRPIIGTRKEPINYYESFRQNSDIVKPEIPSTLLPTQTPSPTTETPSTVPLIKSPYRTSTKPTNNQGRKKNPYAKPSQLNPFFALASHGTHGPHIPLSSVTHGRPGQVGQIKKFPSSSKPPFIQVSLNGKRNVKPVRIQTSTVHSNDLFTASATSGAYSSYQQAGSNIKTRETLGLGLPGSNHYAINQPHAHIEFNRFSLPSTGDNVYQQYNSPLQGFIFPKHPQSNDVNFQYHNQNDEYTRNLVPPPPFYGNKETTNTIKEPQNEIGDKTQVILGKPNIPENVLVQLPPPFQYSSQKVNEAPIQVHVTKEKLNVFHNNVPSNYDGEYVDYDFHSVRKPTEMTKQPTYEVTEGKLWQETPQYTRRPTNQPKIELNVSPFLPTPYRPEGQGVFPTLPTQSEVSTIFTKLSQKQREKATTPNPFGYSVKEVSTHYPIFGKPIFDYDVQTQEISNDITTKAIEEVTTTTTTTREPPRRPHRRRRPDRHRTTTTTTTTEEPMIEMEHYDSQKTQESEVSESVETERPIRRRPHRHRTTTQSSIESEDVPVKVTRGRNRHRHRTTEASVYEPVRRRIRPTKAQIVTEIPENPKRFSESSTESEEVASEKSDEVDESMKTETVELQLPIRHYVTEPVKKIRYEIIRPTIVEVTTTEKIPTTTNIVLSENDLISNPNIEETTTVPTTTIPTTTTTTPTTTTTTVSTNSHRIRRPIKYDNSNRPRFSVKDYRQKLSQYSSTAQPEIYKTTSESLRLRLPSRLRRPTTPVTIDEENTEPTRAKFVPKDPRHGTEDINEAIITEKTVKSVNTRLRPFGRYKSTSTSTTTTTTTPRISIKPNLFTRRRPPPMLSLKNKIYNKYNKNNTELTTERITTTEDFKETTLDYDEEPTTAENPTSTTEETETTTENILKNDSNLYSQRVSDLTSSFKNQYDTPGLFKSVSPTSRRIPNYFTIATDDPILPIEAFFPNIKDKFKEKK